MEGLVKRETRSVILASEIINEGKAEVREEGKKGEEGGDEVGETGFSVAD